MKHEIQKRFNGPIAILDLGCGDVSPIHTMLGDLDISLYCGVDQSQTALSKAEVNLASLDIPFRLYPGDLLDALRAITGRFDVIVASFSLHHFESAEAKTLVLGESRRVLNPAGLLTIIDVFRDEDETREEYLRRWVNFARTSYVALDDTEINSLVDHVQNNDFPETLSTYRSICAAAGYGKFKVLMRDPEKINHLVILEAG